MNHLTRPYTQKVMIQTYNNQFIGHRSLGITFSLVVIVIVFNICCINRDVFRSLSAEYCCSQQQH